jgi:hypothetical protein
MSIYESVSHTDNARYKLIFVHYGADLEKWEDTRFNKNPWMFRKMLIGTPLGFTILDVANRLLLYPEEI